MTLRIAKDLVLPDEAVTQTFGVLAVRGAGKSNTAAVMAEQMFDAHLPFVVIDPVGAWYGLRSSSDGKSAGLPIPIFGGRHGDVPLEKTAGQVIADFIVDERASCVLDVSEFSEGDKIRFLIDFAERLYRRNEEPLHLFLEEADDYAPQRPMRDQARLLGAWERVVRRGRSRGLGITMVTQRSASLNKNVLTQIETLFVLRTTSPQDRKAIGAWVDYHGQSRELVDSLPGLDAGEAWVWSPNWLKIVKRIKVDRRRTFDSGATPKLGSARKPSTLADVDLGAIAKRMADTIERAKAEDPKELRARIKELERELQKVQRVVEPEVRVERVEVPVFADREFEEIVHLLEFMQNLGSTLDESVVRIEKALFAAQDKMSGVGAKATPSVHVRPRASEAPARAKVASPAPRRVQANGSVTNSQQRVLDSLAWFEAMGLSTPSRPALAFIAGSRPTSGGFKNNLGALRSAGLLDYPSEGRVALTDEGRVKAEAPDLLFSAEALQEEVLARLTGSQAAILRTLISAYPRALSRDQLADKVGVPTTSGGFKNNLGALRTLELIDYPSAGYVVALPVLFLEDA